MGWMALCSDDPVGDTKSHLAWYNLSNCVARSTFPEYWLRLTFTWKASVRFLDEAERAMGDFVLYLIFFSPSVIWLSLSPLSISVPLLPPPLSWHHLSSVWLGFSWSAAAILNHPDLFSPSFDPSSLEPPATVPQGHGTRQPPLYKPSQCVK